MDGSSRSLPPWFEQLREHPPAAAVEPAFAGIDLAELQRELEAKLRRATKLR